MFIQSFPIPNATNGKQYLIYDSILNRKHVFTACGVGIVKDGDAQLTDFGTETLFALTEYVNNLGPDEIRTIRFQEIKTVERAKTRVRTTIEKASDKEIIFFVCNNSNVYDAAVAVLRVTWTTPETAH